MNYRLNTGTFMKLGAEVGRGGEATVYEVVGKPTLVAKIYHKPMDADHRQKLPWMISHPPSDPSAPSHQSFAWPAGMITLDGSGPVGFVMPKITGMRKLIEIYSPVLRQRVAPNWTLRHLTRTATNLSSAVAAVHKAGYVIGDLNESNVLVTPEALVTLIDTDSFQATIPQSNGGKLVVPCKVGKPEFIAPELQGKPLGSISRTTSQDNFSLAVLIFLLLAGGSHPYRVLWTGNGTPPTLEEAIQNGYFPANSSTKSAMEPKTLVGFSAMPPAIQALFRRSFAPPTSGLSNQRPTATEWCEVLSQSEKSMIDCPRNHSYFNCSFSCPYCFGLGSFTSKQSGLASMPVSGSTRPSPNSSKRMLSRRMIIPATFATALGGWAVVSRGRGRSDRTLPFYLDPTVEIDPDWSKIDRAVNSHVNGDKVFLQTSAGFPTYVFGINSDDTVNYRISTSISGLTPSAGAAVLFTEATPRTRVVLSVQSSPWAWRLDEETMENGRTIDFKALQSWQPLASRVDSLSLIYNGFLGSIRVKLDTFTSRHYEVRRRFSSNFSIGFGLRHFDGEPAVSCQFRDFQIERM